MNDAENLLVGIAINSPAAHACIGPRTPNVKLMQQSDRVLITRIEYVRINSTMSRSRSYP
jgi:hypothetical protein